MKLSIVIPIYNEEENIDSLINRLRTVVAQMQISCEYIFVNDGSKDHSFQLIKNLALADPAVKYIDFSRNFGHQIAVSAGLDLAAGDRVAIIDADLQDPPELIIEMFAKMDEGYQSVNQVKWYEEDLLALQTYLRSTEYADLVHALK